MEQNHPSNLNQSYFENTGFKNNRKKTQNLVIKLSNIDENKKNITLNEPLRIEKLSDIYLDSFITRQAVTNNQAHPNFTSCFVVSIDEFDIKTSSNENFLVNKLIIPNERRGGANDESFIHKGKKNNFVSSINPCTVKKLMIQITSINKQNMFNADDEDLAIFEFLIIPRE